MVKPSDLPKDDRVQLRMNGLIKAKMTKKDQVKLQALWDKAVDEEYGPVEPELVIAAHSKVEQKKNSKK